MAKGYSQKEGIDYNETYAPVVRYESIRAVLATAAAHNMEIMQFDVKTAFLHGDLSEEIYMEQPQGFVDSRHPNSVCRLQKSLYGLKQASRAWNVKFDNFLLQSGFIRSNADPCVYFQTNPNGDMLILAVWVDDGLLCGTNQESLTSVIVFLREHFDMTVETINHFIGIKISRNRLNRSITLSQEPFIHRILKRFGMTNCNPKVVPADQYTNLSEVSLGRDDDDFDQSVYREAVGCVMYVMVCTRPDIAFAVSQVAQFNHQPKPAHWTAVRRILSYLKGTAAFGVTYHANVDAPHTLLAYSDSDYAGDTSSRRSTSGYLLLLNGGPISWASRRQQCVSLSTTEAEYVAMCETSKEVTWMRRLLDSIGSPQAQPTILLCDNQGAMKLVANQEFHRRTKHIDVRYHYIRLQFQEGTIQPQYVGTKEQLADLLTKPLGGPLFQEMRLQIGVSAV